ncbi:MULTISPECIES: RNA-binding domain-containing protein [unclassified Gordonia (in: high G+C Gram-positive bacteria)]|uniref:RNA-binding domain-containing protein n=1 Tax=unclassified Gordonia (in: high G+C Gram-positive bacteria) TaxID=2657482 RepID=UPI0010F6C8E4|nr:MULTISPECIES: RNA-binding domain-containing protein [unclassified Gordonia (in: high G+C Gram-positive bacteria)]
MTNQPPDDYLTSLLGRLLVGWENEVVEFKEAGDGFSTSKIGEYFSALSNEANLRGEAAGWLVFGVSNRTREVVGTVYRPERDRLQSLKMQIANGTEPSSTFREIHELDHPSGRVLLMEIPAAPRGIPIAWNGHYYARAGESLTSLALDKLDEIRGQTLEDWSAVVVPDATLADLDPAALSRAREAIEKKFTNRSRGVDVTDWPIETLLDRARLTINGQMTRAALLLLGTSESAWRLSPNPAQMTWNLIGQESAYEHFSPPFLLNTTELFQRIRNIRIRLLPEDQLLPEEVSKYDQQSVLEALHNCIAHQDYSRNSRILVTEYPDRLLFQNAGSFFEGHPDDYVQSTRVPLGYRNPFLVQAMVELNMIDTMGYGIRRMNNSQAKRYLPLPDYDLSQPSTVKLVIHGGVVDTAYTRLLLMHTDLPFTDILALDRVQKKLSLPDDAVRRLRQAKLIEGRRPNLHVAANVAAATASKVEYIRTRAQDDEHYAKMITDYLTKFTSATRKDIDSLIKDKLSEALDDRQKATKISNLLTKMKRNGQIRNAGTRSHPRWELGR